MSRVSLHGTGPRVLDPTHIVEWTAWLLFAVLTFRFVAVWAKAFLGLTLPVMGRTEFTVLFTVFSLVHAIAILGLRRALAFMIICAVVTWMFEDIGIITGGIYGRYHYSDQLGPKLGEVPVLIPLAWFMMVYASWIVAAVLLQGTRSKPWWQAVMRVVVAALVMTAWDAVMDPGMARAGVWTWDGGGSYFGVPQQNYAGWLLTTATVYALVELAFRWLRDPVARRRGSFVALPAAMYGLMALDCVLLPDLPELRIVALFGMGFMALLALLRVGTSDAQDPLSSE